MYLSVFNNCNIIENGVTPHLCHMYMCKYSVKEYFYMLLDDQSNNDTLMKFERMRMEVLCVRSSLALKYIFS